MAYVKTVWVDGSAPGITAAQLNRIETGVDDAHAGDVDANSIAMTKLEWFASPATNVGRILLASPTTTVSPSGVVAASVLRFVHWDASLSIVISSALITGTYLNLGPLVPANGVSLFLRYT